MSTSSSSSLFPAQLLHWFLRDFKVSPRYRLVLPVNVRWVQMNSVMACDILTGTPTILLLPLPLPWQRSWQSNREENHHWRGRESGGGERGESTNTMRIPGQWSTCAYPSASWMWLPISTLGMGLKTTMTDTTTTTRAPGSPLSDVPLLSPAPPCGLVNGHAWREDVVGLVPGGASMMMIMLVLGLELVGKISTPQYPRPEEILCPVVFQNRSWPSPVSYGCGGCGLKEAVSWGGEGVYDGVCKIHDVIILLGGRLWFHRRFLWRSQWRRQCDYDNKVTTSKKGTGVEYN